MSHGGRTRRRIKRFLRYTLVAVIASGLTLLLMNNNEQTKLQQLEDLILECFIGESDRQVMEDAAADAMVSALGDRWSYYIPASEYQAHMEQMQNAYVGVGISIKEAEDGKGYEITEVEPDGGAKAAGILPGDILTTVDGQSVYSMDMNAVADIVGGKEGTKVTLTVNRDGQAMRFEVTRKTIEVTVATGKMLDNNIGLVTISNFDERCAKETIAAVNSLVKKGAKALIFDVRFNPGGYKTELVEVLDHLLPEGPLFRSVNYTGTESLDESDEKCVELPMAVLVNGYSYSAAEFFAAALVEYDWAVMVGEPTVGKGYFQQTIQLNDGSAVGLSVGKYFTPKGVSLAEEGGLEPEILVEIDQETRAKIYSGLLAPEEDPQIQAAVKALLEKLK